MLCCRRCNNRISIRLDEKTIAVRAAAAAAAAALDLEEEEEHHDDDGADADDDDECDGQPVRGVIHQDVEV